MKFDASLLVIMGIFWVIYWILRWSLFGPLQRILHERQENIETARALHEAALAETNTKLDAEKSKLAAARLEAAQVRERLRRDAETERQRILDETKARTEQQVTAAQAELEALVARERIELDGRAKSLAGRMVDKLLTSEAA